MFRKILSLLMVVLLGQVLSAVPALAAQTSDEAQAIEKIRLKVAKQGVGDNARVTAKLKNGTKVKGFISQAGANDFTVRDRKTGEPTVIPYSDVVKLENNSGHSTLRNVLIGVGVGVGAVLLVIFVTIAHLD